MAESGGNPQRLGVGFGKFHATPLAKCGGMSSGINRDVKYRAAHYPHEFALRSRECL